MAVQIVEVTTHRPRVTLDFDGVLNSYRTQIASDDPAAPIPDPPTVGAREAVRELRRRGYEVVVLSARTADSPKARRAIEAWLKKHGIEVDAVVDRKLPSVLYVDDKGFRFEGNWDAVLRFLEGGARPWNKR